MKAKKRKSSLDKILNTSSYILFILLTSTLFYSLLRYVFIYKGKVKNQNQSVGDEVKNATWVVFKNEEYGYSLEYPLYLYPTEVKDGEYYLSFITFEETDFSTLNGMALGITKRSLDEEIDFVKNIFMQEGTVELTDTKEGQRNGTTYKLLNFNVGDKETYQDKSLFVINDGRYTMSISTTPDQIEHIINSLKFY